MKAVGLSPTSPDEAHVLNTMWYFNKMKKTTKNGCKIAVLFSLGILDLIFTVVLIALFEAQEINPFMLPILEYSPTLFVIFKIFMTILGCGILYRHKENRFAKIGINLCLTAYSLLLFWHLLLSYHLIQAA